MNITLNLLQNVSSKYKEEKFNRSICILVCNYVLINKCIIEVKIIKCLGVIKKYLLFPASLKENTGIKNTDLPRIQMIVLIEDR